MNSQLVRASFAVAAVMVIGCGAGDDGVSPARDSGFRDGGPADQGRDGGPVEQRPCAAATAPTSPGYREGPIDGRLVVFAIDETGAPVDGATVVVNDGTSRMAVTDNRGCAAFEVPFGPVDVHVMKNGHRYVSWRRLRAEALTVELRALGSESPTAVVEGELLDLAQVLTTTTATRARGALVGPVALSPQNVRKPPVLRTDDRSFDDVVIIGAGVSFPRYRFVARSDLTVGAFAMAGAYTRTGIGADRIHLTHFGIVTGELTPGEEAEWDIAITHELSETVEVSFEDNANLGIVRVTPELVLPGDGGAAILRSGVLASPARVNAPPTTGALAGATYGAFIQAYDSNTNPTLVIEIFDPGTSNPRLDVGQLGAPSSRLQLSGRSLYGALPEADLTRVSIGTAAGGFEWIIVDVGFGGDLYSVELPPVPPGLDDPLTGTKRIIADQSSYADFPADGDLELDAYDKGLNMRRRVVSVAEVNF